MTDSNLADLPAIGVCDKINNKQFLIANIQSYSKEVAMFLASNPTNSWPADSRTRQSQHTLKHTC